MSRHADLKKTDQVESGKPGRMKNCTGRLPPSEGPFGSVRASVESAAARLKDGDYAAAEKMMGRLHGKKKAKKAVEEAAKLMRQEGRNKEATLLERKYGL